MANFIFRKTPGKSPQDYEDRRTLLRLAESLSGSQTDLTTLTDSVATNTSDIATNTSDIATNTSNIATNTSNIAINAAAIISNAALITALTAVVDALNVEGLTNDGKILAHWSG